MTCIGDPSLLHTVSVHHNEYGYNTMGYDKSKHLKAQSTQEDSQTKQTFYKPLRFLYIRSYYADFVATLLGNR